MKLRQLKSYFNEELKSYNMSERQMLIQRISESYQELKPHELVLNYETDLSSAAVNSLKSAMNRLKNQEPLQYITGTSYFFGLEFSVGPSVLIPRPETEELVAWILTHFKKNDALKILDLGTGSGCIAITLAKQLPNARVYAMDTSLEALKMAKINAKNNEVDVEFFHGNILEWKSQNQSFDLIVSNPPYVLKDEQSKMASNVLDYEPHLALFVDDNTPLIFYKAICKIAFENLHSKGFCFMEINEALGPDTQLLFGGIDFRETALKKDTFGKDRMLKTQKK